MPNDCENLCPPDSYCWVFDRVRVFCLIKGATRVEWTLHPDFTDPGPYTFTLQTGTAPVADNSAWVNVGLPVVNTYYAIDDQQRVFGKTNWTHYHVKLITPLGTYYSQPK